MTQPERGAVVGGRYRLESILGEGGMAVVWRAVHTTMERPVALKLVRREYVKDEQVRDMFVREARVGSRIGKHPHIVDFLDADVDAELGVPFLAMELLSGEPLDVRIKRDGPVVAAVTADLLEQLADALDQAHGAGVFHRDLKPQNLFLERDKKQRLNLKVLDFGIAKLADSVTQSSTHVGTPAYSAPEQLGNAWRTIAEQKQKQIATQVSAATDVWALGLVAYEMLTGTGSGSLWGATTLAELPVKIVLESTPRASQRAGERSALLPQGFDGWLARCLDLDATKRFQSAGEAVGSILPLLRGNRSSAPVVPTGPSPPIGPIGPTARNGPPPHPQQHALAHTPPQAGWGNTPAPGWSHPPDPRLYAWAAHHRAEVRMPADPRFYAAWNPFQFLPVIDHVTRDARLAVRDATLYLVESYVNDALRRAAGEDRYVLAFLVSPRLYYRAAVRSKLTTGLVEGLGQIFDGMATGPTLGDPHFERHFDLRFPTHQEGQMALPFALRQVLMNAGFRGVLELRQGGFVMRRAEASTFDPLDLDKLLEASRAVYAAIAP